jgi:hypothetical protein
MTALDAAIDSHLRKAESMGMSGLSFMKLLPLLRPRPPIVLTDECRDMIAELTPRWSEWNASGCWTDERNTPDECCDEDEKNMSMRCSIIGISREIAELESKFELFRYESSFSAFWWIHLIDCRRKRPIKPCWEMHALIGHTKRWYEFCCEQLHLIEADPLLPAMCVHAAEGRALRKASWMLPPTVRGSPTCAVA